MSLLIVTLPLPPAPAGGEYGWTLWAADGSLRSSGTARLALLPTGDDVTIAVPAAALSWHQVTLPQGSMGGAVRLRSVLNGLLEDRLLDEPELLHFALAPDAAVGRPVWVAACNRIWLRSAVQAFEGAGRRVGRIIPEFVPAAPDEPVALFATGEPDDARITVCDAAGVLTLPLDAGGVAALGLLPDDTLAQAEPAVAALAEDLLQRQVPIVLPAERWLQATRTGWDLAQLGMASTGRARAGKKATAVLESLWRAPQWRAARWGVAVLLLAQLVGVNAWAWKERRALEAKRAAIGTILVETFPNVKPYEPQLQMVREVAILQQATGGVSPVDLEPMLGALATSLPVGRTPSAIDYSGGQLRLRGLGLAMSDLNAISSALAARGYGARSEGDLLLVQAEGTR
jgi:general secretion pathway protein L